MTQDTNTASGAADLSLQKRVIFDAIRSAYDLGYSDARNARSTPGDSAPGYKGRQVEADHGGALSALSAAQAGVPAQPGQEGEEGELQPCPCGKTPTALQITGDEQAKWAHVSGNCCGTWEVEYRNNYAKLASNEAMAAAKAAWNDADRAARAAPQPPAEAQEPWYGHQFKEVQRGVWRCTCGKQLKEQLCTNGTPNTSLLPPDAAKQGATQMRGDGSPGPKALVSSIQAESSHDTHPAPQRAGPAEGDALDAARYRWLREGNDAKHGAAWHVAVNLYGCEWDAAIDAALAAHGGSDA